ncbi:FliO/MopB family protein [Desulfitobacterium metallireducens]|uniref:Flagellar biosynthetic protein FliO n=1 Tax=Desulfitobacterium metallireducens DSM 15288 TaxID=871968 RepID=W0EF17_9FIRM|nr:flagellar biosynthetic protein FliO [Desulfitobacterium metallireducens]AHF07779.1 flagellar biosynthetic protein FliO [Desulfitobacterium metallireducens DSM 15288]
MSDFESQPWVPSETVTPQATSSSWWGIVITVLIFLIILFVALRMIRRLNNSAMRGMNAPWARVLDRQILFGQQSLYLVEIAGKLQVLGGTDHHIEKLTEIDDPELATEILDELANRPVERAEGEISKLMQKLFSGKKRTEKDSFSKELERLMKEVEK